MTRLNNYKWGEIFDHFEIDPVNVGFIFKALNQNHSTEMTAIGLNDNDDIDFVLNSKQKRLSLTALYYYDINKDIPSGYNSMITNLSNLIFNKYYKDWLRIYTALFSDYNPIENYSMTEDENQKTDFSITDNQNSFGFNTTDSDGVPVSKNVSNSKGEFDDNHRRLTRSGNIGVTTSQQMIASEIELRKNNFKDIVINDINNFIAMPIY